MKTADDMFADGIKEEFGPFTVQELADGLGVSKKTIQLWLLGKNLPGKAMRKSILALCRKKSGVIV